MLWAIAVNIIVSLLSALVAFMVLLPLEVLAPKADARSPTMPQRLRGLRYLALFIPLTAVLGLVLGLSLNWIEPIIPARVWMVHPIMTAAIVLLGSDFLYYWMHRVQHRWFWNIHAVHHSIDDLGVLNSFNHPLQRVFEVVLMGTPMALLGVGAGLPMMILMTVQGYWLHTATSLNFGPLRWLLNDNRHHRLHHSREAEHFNKNFGLITPWWDILFGTAHMHDPKAWPDTGVAEIPEPLRAHHYLFGPFKPTKAS